MVRTRSGMASCATMSRRSMRRSSKAPTFADTSTGRSWTISSGRRDGRRDSGCCPSTWPLRSASCVQARMHMRPSAARTRWGPDDDFGEAAEYCPRLSPAGGLLMQLYLVRHGIAVDGGEAIPDGSRGLTDKGRRRFHKTARAFGKLGHRLDLILTSPLVRAVQTAEILAGATKHGEVAVLEELDPKFDVATLRTADAKPVDVRWWLKPKTGTQVKGLPLQKEAAKKLRKEARAEPSQKRKRVAKKARPRKRAMAPPLNAPGRPAGATVVATS